MPTIARTAIEGAALCSIISITRIIGICTERGIGKLAESQHDEYTGSHQYSTLDAWISRGQAMPEVQVDDDAH